MRDTQQEILHFWFEELDSQQWFQQSDSVDEEIRERFAVTYDMASDGLCNHWSVDAHGSLALILVLDQFSRHIFRNSPKSFESDERALLIAKQALQKDFDQRVSSEKRSFLYLPFQHSEALVDQKKSVELFAAMAEENPEGHLFAKRHLVPIEKFGRFPHRNKILGRESTEEEIEFLKTHKGFL